MKKTKINNAEIKKIDEEIERVHRKIKTDKELRKLIRRGLAYGTVDIQKALREGIDPSKKIKKSDKFAEIAEKLDSILNKENINPRWDFITLYTGCGVYWWYLQAGEESGCHYQSIPSPINDSDKCDIHYEPIFYLHYEEEWVEGMINMAGCEFASNCGGNCGTVNSKRDNTCMQHPQDYPELYQQTYIMYAYYTSTGLGGCWNVNKPEGCSFDFRNQYSQHMVLNYYLGV